MASVLRVEIPKVLVLDFALPPFTCLDCAHLTPREPCEGGGGGGNDHRSNAPDFLRYDVSWNVVGVRKVFLVWFFGCSVQEWYPFLVVRAY